MSHMCPYMSHMCPYMSHMCPYIAFKTALSHCRGGFFSFPPLFFEESRTQVYRAPSLHDGFSHACACMCTRICTRVHTHVHTHATARCFILFYFVLVCFRFAFSFPDTHTHTHIRTQTHAHTHANTHTYARELAGMARPVRRRRPRHHLRYALVVKTSSKD